MRQQHGFPTDAVDSISGAITNIGHEDLYISQGKLFESYVQTTIAAGGSYSIAIKTPLDKELHYRPSNIAPSADKITVEFFEDGTYTGGTDVAITNHKRSDGVSQTQALRSGITVVTNGEKVTQVYLPGAAGIGQSRTGGAFNGSPNKWILKKDTVYIYKINNGSTEPNTVQINFFWYEEDETP